MKAKYYFSCVFAICMMMALVPAMNGTAVVLYQQNFDDLESLGTPPGFNPLPDLEREPTALAIGEFAMTDSTFEFFESKTEPFTVQFLIAVTQLPTPDSLGTEVLIRGRATGSEAPGVQLQWGVVSEGRPAFNDGAGWLQVGDLNIDGEENADETWPEPLPVSTPDNPQWVPVQLVVQPAAGIYEYWQGEPNDFEFSTLELFQDDLFMPNAQPNMTNYVFNMPSDGAFVDELALLNDSGTFLEDDFESQPTRDNETIAIDNQSLTLLQNIDNGVAEFGPLEENFTIRYFMAVETQGQENQRAAQLLINGDQGIGPQLAWGNLDPGLANYFDGTAWRQVGDTNQDLQENEDETWPPPLAVTDPSDPSSAQWIPIQIEVDMANSVFRYYQGDPNDFAMETLQQYGGDLPMRNPNFNTDSVNFQNSQRGGGTFYVDNFNLTAEAGETILDENFEGDFALQEPPLTGGGALDSDFAVGAKSLRVRAGEDDIFIDIEDQTQTVTADFLLAITNQGSSGARAARLHVRGDGNIGAQMSWGEIEPGRVNFFDGSQWVIIGDANKDGSEDADETWVEVIPVSLPAANWTPIRLILDPQTDSFEYWQGNPGDTSFDNLTRVEPDPTFRNAVEEIEEFRFVFTDRFSDDFFLDNITISNEETPVELWQLY